ncbi:hypothetical protein [Streptomyces cinereoruber]|uniref:hypothetical protein n=1 Tax=Streptomyces cinereoruber TaxID=67260 RepID=UPI003641D865
MPGLNIAAKRRVSLKGFAEGWDDCYVMVRVATETERREYADSIQAATKELAEKMKGKISSSNELAAADFAIDMDRKTDELQRNYALSHIEKGVVVSTHDDGSTELAEFEAKDVPMVVEALGFAWLQEIVSVSTGADRLKAQRI